MIGGDSALASLQTHPPASHRAAEDPLSEEIHKDARAAFELAREREAENQRQALEEARDARADRTQPTPVIKTTSMVAVGGSLSPGSCYVLEF